MNAATTEDRGTLDRVRERRNALRLALETLEDANARPVGPNWRARMTAALDHVAAMLSTHVGETERPGGFFDELVRHEPRVNQHVDELRAEHVSLRSEVARLVRRCANPDCGATDMREDVVHLMGLLHRHRQAGADLLYEAYQVDVASGD